MLFALARVSGVAACGFCVGLHTPKAPRAVPRGRGQELAGSGCSGDGRNVLAKFAIFADVFDHFVTPFGEPDQRGGDIAAGLSLDQLTGNQAVKQVPSRGKRAAVSVGVSSAAGEESDQRAVEGELVSQGLGRSQGDGGGGLLGGHGSKVISEQAERKH